jgi:hypothetical protein
MKSTFSELLSSMSSFYLAYKVLALDFYEYALENPDAVVFVV